MLRRRLGPILLIALGALLVMGVVGWLTFLQLLANPGPVPVPDSVAGLPLARNIVGVEAVAEVTRLHGKAFPLTSGAMAIYGKGAVTVWVSGAPADPMAAEMVRAMTDKIAEGRSPFTPLDVRQFNGRAIYELAGMGQRHFYFRSGSLVIWLAVDEAIAEKALEEVTAFYP